MTSYRSLDPAQIVQTADGLQQRIGARFPASGLSRIGTELHSISLESQALTDWLAQPNYPLRIAGAATIALMLAAVVALFLTVQVRIEPSNLEDFLQGIEAGINEVIFLGIAIFFFTTLENRIKRGRALKALHVLRSMAHIIDMHQLTKDPERVAGNTASTITVPSHTLSPAELVRYLDYCTELLAIISKIAALYVQRFEDPVTLVAVNEVEELAGGLSHKIWQKIMIMDRVLPAR